MIFDRIRLLQTLLTGACIFSCFTLSARSWKEIAASGTLQVLLIEADRYPSANYGLHRVEMPIDRQRVLLHRFAKEQKLKIEYRSAPGFKTLFSMLEKGQGDLIASSLAETPERKKRYLLTVPFAYTREMIFTAKNSKLKGSDATALKGWRGEVLPGTTYAANLRALAAKNKAVRFQELQESLSHDELIEKVASGKIDYSALNECDLDAWQAYRSDIRKLFSLRRRVPLVFAARKVDTELISRLNKSITRHSPLYKGTKGPASKPKEGTAQSPEKKASDGKAPAAPQKDAPPNAPGSPEETAPYEDVEQIISIPMTGDLDEIRERGYIRMLTSNNTFCCYLQKGELAGFEYELATRFAEALDVMVVTVIPEDFQDLQKYLAEGKGDFIAANYTRSDDRIKAHPELTFCAPYFPVNQVLVGRPGEKITKPEDLNGRTIHVLKGSAYVDTLMELRNKGIHFRMVYAPDDYQTFTIIRDVAEKKYDLTVADETFLQMVIDSGGKVKKLLTLGETQSYSWVVRKENPKLAAAINAFFKKENRSTFFNLCRKRYYNTAVARKMAPFLLKDKELTISPYDALFKKYGKLYDFDWYFLAAQAYQESRFQADRVNHIGAAGLMQVLPKTAREVGVSNLTNPENGICAGTRYMAKLRKNFPGQIAPDDLLCFSLASYNAGYGHVQDARKLAAKMKLNPNVWFGNTEKALVMLEEPRYHKRSKFGYCRAAETVPYVQNIMFNNYHYRQMLQISNERTKKEPK